VFVAAAIFVYTHARGLLAAAAAHYADRNGFAVARVWFWPESITLRDGARSAYRIVLVTASFLLIRYRWRAGKSVPGCLVSACCCYIFIGIRSACTCPPDSA